MNKNLIFLLFFTLHLSTVVEAQRISLEQDISDGYLDEHSKVEAAFILSGVNQADSLAYYVNWYNQLIDHIDELALDNTNVTASAHTVFLFLHTSWLKTYALESTTLTDIVNSKEYNCVAATILYNLVCEDLNWEVEAFETPTHVYTIFKNFGRNLMVENTSTMGFDIMRNLQNYSRYLAGFYPEREVLRIGLDRLYYYENSKGRTITNTELLGLLAYNRAYLAKKNNNFKEAYDYVLLAQQFNRDSRSNIDFEIGLYYSWGRELFTKNEFLNAFNVFADAFYRYPDNEDFKKNTLAAFFNSLTKTWHAKNWAKTKQLVSDIELLEVLKDSDVSNIERYLYNWRNYFLAHRNENSAREALSIISRLSK